MTSDYSEEQAFMKRIRFSHLGVAGVVIAALLTQGVMGARASHPTAKKTTLKGKIIIGQVTSQSGAFAEYGKEEIQGFKAGLAYATNGSMKVDKAKIVVKTYTDVPAS